MSLLLLCWHAVSLLTRCFRAYRKKALLWHPDKLEQNKSDDGFYIVDGEKVDKAKAEVMFKDLNEANEVLTDPTKKRRFFPPSSNLAPPPPPAPCTPWPRCLTSARLRFDTGADIEEEEMGGGGGFGGMDQADLMRYSAGRTEHSLRSAPRILFCYCFCVLLPAAALLVRVA